MTPNTERAAVESALTNLNKHQHEARERATFVGMSAEEKKAYDDRARRIGLLQLTLNKRDAEPMSRAGQSHAPLSEKSQKSDTGN